MCHALMHQRAVNMSQWDDLYLCAQRPILWCAAGMSSPRRTHEQSNRTPPLDVKPERGAKYHQRERRVARPQVQLVAATQAHGNASSPAPEERQATEAGQRRPQLKQPVLRRYCPQTLLHHHTPCSPYITQTLPEGTRILLVEFHLRSRVMWCKSRRHREFSRTCRKLKQFWQVLTPQLPQIR